jgi:hypothetical protein
MTDPDRRVPHRSAFGRSRHGVWVLILATGLGWALIMAPVILFLQ